MALDEADGIFDELAWHDDDVPPEAAARPGEHVTAEVAAALRLTGRGAQDLLALAGGITRLSQVPAALAAGVIDLPRAAVFARELLVLDDELAAAAEAMVRVQFVAFVPDAPPRETGRRVAPVSAAAGHPGVDAAQRPHLHHRTRTLLRLISLSTAHACDVKTAGSAPTSRDSAGRRRRWSEGGSR